MPSSSQSEGAESVIGQRMRLKKAQRRGSRTGMRWVDISRKLQPEFNLSRQSKLVQDFCRLTINFVRVWYPRCLR